MRYLCALVITFICFCSSARAGEEYARCLDLNYQTDTGLLKCAEDETARLSSELDKRYDIIANHKFFRPWNDDIHSFAELKNAWLKYRNDYCNLLGYSQIHAGNNIGYLTEARCKLQETERFRAELEALVKNYQSTFKPKIYNGQKL